MFTGLDSSVLANCLHLCVSTIACLPVSCQGNFNISRLRAREVCAVKFTLSSWLSRFQQKPVRVQIIQCKDQDTNSGRVSGLGLAKWSFVRQVFLLATDWEIKEQSFYGIMGWSLFRGYFTTRVYVAAFRT